MRRRWVRATPLLLAAVLLFAGCGNDSARPAGSASSAASSSAAPVPVNDPALAALLLAPAELGPTFADATLGDPVDTTQPCGQPDPRTVVHPQARAIALLADYLEGAGVAENLSRFASVDDASQVMTLLRAGVTCAQGTILDAGSAAPATLSDVQDVTAQTGADDAFAVVIELPAGTQVTTIAGRVNDTVAAFIVGAKSGAGALDPLQVAKQGIDKVRAG